MPKVTLHKSFNFLTVEPTTEHIFELLCKALTYTEKVTNPEFYAYKRAEGVLPFIEVKQSMFTLDAKKRLSTSYGYWKLIRDTLKAAGYEVKLKDNTPAKPKDVYTPVWENIKDISLKENQPEFISAFLQHQCGRFDCPPGFGKSFMIGVLARLLPYAKFDIVSTRVAVLRDRIYPELVQMVGDVGIVGGGKKLRDRRVMCYVAKSMQYSNHDADILIVDEGHEMGTDGYASKLLHWHSARRYSLSASHNKRTDNNDFKLQGIFGDIIYRVSYKQAQKANMVVPIHIKWSAVPFCNVEVGRTDSPAAKNRKLIWTNTTRNKIIARDANLYDADTQVLITVSTLEHALHLKKVLPDYTLVYAENGITKQEFDYYQKHGLLTSVDKIMTFEQRQKLTKDFEQGTLKKVIATTVWNVGVSFNALQVLIRADGTGSAIGAIQIPGRVSRTSKDKEAGIVHDYMDQFNPSTAKKALDRFTCYEEMGWKQEAPINSPFHRRLTKCKNH
jgi:superfamily II DNA or RNA helicase